MGALWKNVCQLRSWWPDRWEAPEREFIGHRDIVTRSLARYEFVAPNIQGVLLDVGCGRGYGFEHLALTTSRQVGVDISRDFLGKARDQCPAVSFVCARGDALPFADSVFDSIVAFEVIEHIDDDVSLLKELKRVACQDAIIAVSTPNKLVSSGNRGKPLDPFHVREYREPEFRHLMRETFSSVEVFGQKEHVGELISRNSLIDRIPVSWKYVLPHYIQAVLSVALRPPLRLQDCRFQNDNLEHAHTFIALCRP